MRQSQTTPKKIYYYKTTDGYEIDFITQDRHGKFEIIQVAWEMDNAETIQRELRALKQAESELGFPGKHIDGRSFLERFVQK